MAAARAWHTATLLANGNVLIAGGSNSVGDLATAELYDPTTGSFSATGSMVSKRAFQVATLLSSGNVLVTGGSAGSGLLSSAEVYDAVAGSFRATGDMIAARDSHIAVLLANGTVLVAGGSSDFAPDGSTLVPGGSSAVTAELYNPGSGTFTQTGSMVAARAFPAGVLLQDGRVLVSGGSDCLAVIVCDSSVDSAELYK